MKKYLPDAQELTDREVEAAGALPGTPKFQKLKEQMIAKKLDARPKKVIETVAEAPVIAVNGRR